MSLSRNTAAELYDKKEKLKNEYRTVEVNATSVDSCLQGGSKEFLKSDNWLWTYIAYCLVGYFILSHHVHCVLTM